jgi:cystathionine beta-lyase
MGLADMDFRSAPAILDALERCVAHGVFGYASPPAELEQAVAEMLQAQYRWSVRREWLSWLPGLVPAIHAACRAVCAPGEAVMTAVPAYPPFLKAPPAAGRRLLTVPLRQEGGGGWRFDLPAMARQVTADTRLLILCNPHNPTGRVLERDELAALADFCLDHRLVILADEIHCGLILEPQRRHIPIASLGPEVAARTITLMSPSKTFNLAGLGCAFAVTSDPELHAALRQAAAGIVPHVGVMGFAAALAAYRQGGAWHAALLDYLRGNRRLLAERLPSLTGLAMIPPQGTYLAWLDGRALAHPRPAAFFTDAGVGMQDGADFGCPGFLRLNFGCPRSVLATALDRMARALAGNGNAP